MGLTSTSWDPHLLLESQKFWFYAIATSLLLSFYRLLYTPTSATVSAAAVVSEKDDATGKTEVSSTIGKTEANNTTNNTTNNTSPIQTPVQTPIQTPLIKNKEIYRQIIMDSCDLCVPGAAVGWIPITPLSVGICMFISSLLAMGSMWPRIQASAAVAAAAKKKKGKKKKK
ncbi:hypothetical protein FKW77_002142 [Venturia effusa]|uniref:Uncharacterized protein n=1 Tax=Venturia effusa TaxID=50376 RepID=A0A517LQR1_9PEZI|nr:hypothetical protein FKW77_002142 [Venturia effusa]